ncbi:MAG: hypothetical protein ONB05_05590 [candidate division KSB1 bacterium]|nr:hypothetical protein [candidate division KSB1 bacterium]
MTCATTGSKFILQGPEEGKSLLVGAVLVENDGIDDLYQSKTSNIIVIVVGKSIQNGEEVTKGYRVKTDKDGYFMIQNVPPGSYVLKGIELDIGYTTRFLVTSRWEGNRQLYLQESRMVDYNVRIWPPETHDRIIDMNINYFKIDNAGRIFYDRFSLLNNALLGLKDKRHTMANPKAYFKEKYPQSKWFNE